MKTFLKSVPTRSEKYRRLVAHLPCKACGIQGYGQAAHANTGKGMGLKTDDRTCFSLCADRPGVPGCHSRLDQGALFTKEDRQRIELMWAAQTRRQIEDAGQWPKNLPKFETKAAVAHVFIASPAMNAIANSCQEWTKTQFPPAGQCGSAPHPINGPEADCSMSSQPVGISGATK